MKTQFLQRFLLVIGAFAMISLLAEVKPVRFGIITDTHIDNRKESVDLCKKAFQFFKTQEVDAVVHVGDLAERSSPDGYAYYRQAFQETFGENPPKAFYVFAMHDTNNVPAGKEAAFAIFREKLGFEHDLCLSTELGGYPVIIVPQYVEMGKLESMLQEARKSHPQKPILLFDHFPALDTVDNSVMWGDEARRILLNQYPEVIQISGHIHGSLRNEGNIWQGEFTAVNAGGLSTWSGLAPGTSAAGVMNYGALVLELYPEKALFRRFDVRTGEEYRADAPWCVPLPFVSATAPYRPEIRYSREATVAPFFGETSELGIDFVGTPCQKVTLSIPEATGGDTVFYYWVDLEEMNTKGKFVPITRRGIRGNFHLPPNDRPETLSTDFCRGYFDAGKNYRFTVTPESFYHQFGKALTTEFSMPAMVEDQVVFLSENPMTELPFTNWSQEKTFAPEGNHYHIKDHGMLTIPDCFANAPANAKFRITLDFQVTAKKPYFWTIELHCLNPHEALFWRTTVPLNHFEPQRLAWEFTNKTKRPPNLLFYNGVEGNLIFHKVKIQQLED